MSTSPQEAPLETFPALDALTHLRAGFFRRVPGLDVQTDRDTAMARLASIHRAALDRAGFDGMPLATAVQVHGNSVREVFAGDEFPVADCDALMTRERRLCLGIYVADCAAVFIADKFGRGIALAHSGRKGTELRIVPRTWIMEQGELPPTAVLHAPMVGGQPIRDWHELAEASQRERNLIIKASGFHETAWGARSVVLGSDCSREEWQAGVAHAIALAPTNLHVLQVYKKPRRLEHPLFDPRAAVGSAPVAAAIKPGRLRLCPYYFVIGGRAELSGALATFCPPDKKIIHGMTDAALLPCCIVPA